MGRCTTETTRRMAARYGNSYGIAIVELCLAASAGPFKRALFDPQLGPVRGLFHVFSLTRSLSFSVQSRLAVTVPGMNFIQHRVTMYS